MSESMLACRMLGVDDYVVIAHCWWSTLRPLPVSGGRNLFTDITGAVCLQVKLCDTDPHPSALEVRFSRRGAIQIYVYLYLYRKEQFWQE